jgi:hypothetical protein
MSATWLEATPTAFGRKPVHAALFGASEIGLEGALFDMAGEPVADAIAPTLTAAKRADLEAERAELLARLSVLNDMLG